MGFYYLFFIIVQLIVHHVDADSNLTLIEKNNVINKEITLQKNGDECFSLDHLKDQQDLRSFKLIFYGDNLSEFRSSLSTMPKSQNLEKFSLEYVGLKYGARFNLHGGDQLFWSYLADRFPNLKNLGLQGCALQQSGFEVFCTKEGKEEGRRDKTLEGLVAIYPDLEELNLRGCYPYVDFETFPGLNRFSKLRVLDVRNNILFTSNHFLQALFHLENLEVLRMGNPREAWDLDPSGESEAFQYSTANLPPEFYHGKFLHLIELDLSGLKVPDLEFSSVCPDLKVLILSNASFNQMEKLISLEKLEKLVMQGINFTEHLIEQMSWTTLFTLKEADFAQSKTRNIPWDTFAPQLRILNLANTNTSAADMRIIGSLIHLEELNLSGTKISGASLKKISQLSNLKKLDLSKTNLKNGTLSDLHFLSNLLELNLDEVEITRDALFDLVNCLQIKKVSIKNLPNTNITSADIEELQHLMPNTEIIKK